MLTRAAKNAYSWWWASHIRTKQSKWLEDNIQEMEEKVEYILKIITEDGDSFRVRAEQYYRKRPEIVNFVEDTFRGYRALAERYDHLSKELQSANRTIAVIFPERVKMSIDEDDLEDLMFNPDEQENKLPPNQNLNPNVPLPLPMPPKPNSFPKMENVVHAMMKKKSKMPTQMMSKKGLIKLGVEEKASKCSGLTKEEALDEIDRLQKDILGLQTEKEFIKTSYENAVSKYWQIEDDVTEMHAKISALQDEFGVGAMFEDTDAQTLMSSSALKTCQETLTKIKNKQQRFKKEAAVEHRRVDEIRKKFESLIAKNNENSDLKNLEETMEHVKDKKAKIEEKIEDTQEEKKTKMKEEILGDNNETMTISQVAEKIEKLVDKVINFETEVTSQAALVMRLRLENDELHEHLQSLEHEKETLLQDSNQMNSKIKRLEEELDRVQALDQKVKGKNVQLEASFDEAGVGLEKLTKDLAVAKPDEKTPEDEHPPKDGKVLEENEELKGSGEELNQKDEGDDSQQILALKKGVVNEYEDADHGKSEDDPDWSLIFSYGAEDREKMLLEEFTTTLRNYKEVQKKLHEIQKRNRATSFRSAVQMKMLQTSNESKDAEIRLLHEKLKLFEANVVDLEGRKTRNPNEESIDEGSRRRKELDEPVDLELKKARDLVDEVTEKRKGLETIEFELKKAQDLVDGEIERRKRLESPDLEAKKPRDLANEGIETQKRIETIQFELTKSPERRNGLEDVQLELKKSRDLVNQVIESRNELKKARDSAVEFERTQTRKHLEKALDSGDEGTERRKEADEMEYFETDEPPDSIDEGTQRRIEPDQEPEYFELDEAQDKHRKEADENAEFDFKSASDSVEEGMQRRKEVDDEIDEVSDIEDEIRREIDDFRKENMELWLRFSTSYHQINRFQDSYNDLIQEIKEVKEKKHRHHSSSVTSDLRPIYRHLQDMETELTLWLEKSEILEDDLQHRVISLSEIQEEIANLIPDGSKNETTALNDYQAAKFQGEVMNMKQENGKVLEELRAASDRVRTLLVEMEKTLATLDEELGRKKRSSSRVPLRSFLFGVKLRKRKHSFLTCMSPSLKRKYSNLQTVPPEPPHR